jgi:dipeptidyl aminopeptidase/acylaminoacyl peptidase
MRALAMPVLVLQGERDDAVLFEQAYEISAAVRENGNARVELVLYPEYGHEFAPRVGGRAALPKLAPDVVTRLASWLGAL